MSLSPSSNIQRSGRCILPVGRAKTSTKDGLLPIIAFALVRRDRRGQLVDLRGNGMEINLYMRRQLWGNLNWRSV
jgi:hypothetical protein